MRFENLTRNNQLENLCRLHNMLNDGLFKGELKRSVHLPPIEEWPEETGISLPGDSVVIGIAHAGKGVVLNAMALFSGHAGFDDEEIYFDHTYLKYAVSDFETEEQQIEVIASIMLHEMIHQYIHETGKRDNSMHGRTFKRCCKEHGLIRKAYLNGDGRWEHDDSLSAEAKEAIKGFHFEY